MVGRKQVIGMWAAGIEGREGSTRGPARSVIPFRTGGFLGSEVRARQTTLEKKTGRVTLTPSTLPSKLEVNKNDEGRIKRRTHPLETFVPEIFCRNTFKSPEPPTY
jgi:hypothetical protein